MRRRQGFCREGLGLSGRETRARLHFVTLKMGRMMGHDKKLIRNSTAEFLIFTAQAGEKSIEARYEDDNYRGQVHLLP